MVYSIDVDIKQLENVISAFNECSDSFAFIYDLTEDTYFISEYACKFFNFSSPKFSNASQTIIDMTYVDDKAMLRSELDLLRSGQKDGHNLEYRWVNKNGKPVWINCRGKIHTHSSGHSLLLGYVSIVDEMDKTDILTGLPTEVQLHNDFASVWTKDLCLSGFVLKIDIDNIAFINEEYGVNTGDLILSKVGDCCRKVSQGLAKVYRLNSDEFLFVNLNGEPAIAAQKMYESLKREISESQKSMGNDIIFTVSGGVIAFKKEPSQLDTLLRKLNFSVSVAKKNGRNRLFVFNKSDYDAYLRKRSLQQKLRNSIKNNFEGFELFYQPVVNAKKMYLDEEKKILNVIGAEALLRWSHPDYGMLSPDEFIPLLERSHMIVSVGRWILRNAFNQCRKWNEIMPDFRMSVNISYIQVQKSDVLSDVETALLLSGVNPSNITMELTESGYIDNVEALQKLTESFANMGLNVDIDDFGTGYSNLRYLQYMHANTLKLDYTFVHKAANGNEGDRNVIKHITQMAHEIGLKVCMEGVENGTELDRLKIYEPDKFQGFYFSRPVGSNNFYERFISPCVGDSEIGSVSDLSDI